MRKNGSRRDRAEKRERQSSDLVTKAPVFGSLDNFQSLFYNLLDNKSFLYNTAEKTSILAAIIQMIANDVAKTPVYLTKKIADREYIPFKTSKRYDHIIANPNNEDTEFTFKFKLLVALLIEGKAALISTYKKGKQSLHVFQYRYVTEKPNTDGSVSYYINDGQGKLLEVPEGLLKIIKVPGFDKNGDGSFSAVKAALEEVLLYRNLLQHQSNFTKNGMMAKGFLHVADARLTYEQRQSLSRDFSDKTSNLNAATTVVLPNGVEYVPVQHSAQEGAVLELMGAAVDSVLKVFRVPKSLFDQEFASYAAADVQLNQYYKNTIYPYFKLIEDALNSWDEVRLATEHFQFDKTHFLSAEEMKAKGEAKQSNANAASILQGIGHFSVNELRETAGFDRVTNDDGKELNEDAEEIPLMTIDERTFERDSATSQPTNPNESGEIPATEDVRKETLNGAQIQLVVALVQAVARGEMPRDAAINIIMISFNLDRTIAESMMGSAGNGFTIEPQEESTDINEEKFYDKLLLKEIEDEFNGED